MKFSGFDWDSGNLKKCLKHGVSTEIVESLFQRAVAILPDEDDSQTEQRFRAVEKTKEGRAVFVVFTLRQCGKDILIRPISARYMHEREVKSYEAQNPDL